MLKSGMLWKPLQFGIMSAVVISNAIWHWTPNGLLAGLVGTAAAFVLTVVIVKLSDLPKTKRSTLTGRSTLFLV
jgi:hypothetical protein